MLSHESDMGIFLRLMDRHFTSVPLLKNIGVVEIFEEVLKLPYFKGKRLGGSACVSDNCLLTWKRS